jgi:hypothetical protein
MLHHFLPLATWAPIFLKQSNIETLAVADEVGCNIPENKMMMIDPQKPTAKSRGPDTMLNIA